MASGIWPGRVLGVCMAVCWVLAPVAPGAHADVRAGAAKVELKLPARVPLAGYSRRRGAPSTGTHDPVRARALVLDDGGTTAALVSVDLLIIDEELAAAVEDRLRERLPDRPMTLLLAATHTHSGPGGYGRRFFEKISMGHFDPAVFDALVAQIADAVERAVERLEPVASMTTAVLPTEGLVVNRTEAGGAVDADLTVVTLHGQARRPLAVLVNFSAHPTTLGAWNYALSADYPGVVTETIERERAGAVSLFFVGAVGDQAPRKQGEGFERAQQEGLPLALQALAASGRLHERLALSSARRTVTLPRPRVRIGRWTLPGWLGRALADDDATLTAVRLGPVVFLGAPCDLSAELGLELKRWARERGTDAVMIGFANDYIGYALPRRVYDSGAYEAQLMFNGPSTGELIVEELKRMIDELVTGDK